MSENQQTQMTNPPNKQTKMTSPPKDEKKKSDEPMVKLKANEDFRFDHWEDGRDVRVNRGDVIEVPRSLATELTKPYEAGYPQGETFNSRPVMLKKAEPAI